MSNKDFVRKTVRTFFSHGRLPGAQLLFNRNGVCPFNQIGTEGITGLAALTAGNTTEQTAAVTIDCERQAGTGGFGVAGF